MPKPARRSLILCQQLDSFIATIADGKVDEKEVQNQEARLVQLMQEIRAALDDTMHAKNHAIAV